MNSVVMNFDLLEIPTPGQMLQEDYLEPLGIKPAHLAEETGLNPSHVSELLDGKRSITPEISAALGKVLGMSEEFWLGVQRNCDQIEARRKAGAFSE